MEKILKFKLELEDVKYVQTYLEVINIFLPKKLTGKEMEVIATFLSLPKIIVKDDMFNSYARGFVREKMRISHAGLANYLKSLTDKGFLVKDDKGKIRLRRLLKPEGDSQNFSINIINVKKHDN